VVERTDAELDMRLDPELLNDADQLRRGPAMHEASLFTDIPGAIWTAFLGAWALLFGLFVVFFSGDGKATLAVVTSAFFATMILGLPASLASLTDHPARKWPRVIVTNSGPVPVWAAATQILLIPVAAVFGIILFIALAM
jgi:hypothetical protein